MVPQPKEYIDIHSFNIPSTPDLFIQLSILQEFVFRNIPKVSGFCNISISFTQGLPASNVIKAFNQNDGDDK